jgi:hypothetical protein
MVALLKEYDDSKKIAALKKAIQECSAEKSRLQRKRDTSRLTSASFQ